LKKPDSSKEEINREGVRGLYEENRKLVDQFGAEYISGVGKLPDFYTFSNGLIFSHRNLGDFLGAIKRGEKTAIVSGLNPSSSMHIAHLSVFDTNLFFQREYGSRVFIPMSDDESYVTGKIETQEEGLRKSLSLTKSILALGFDPAMTVVIIDQLYPQIYNLAFSISRKVTLSTVKATYGYTPDKNIGMHFYPAVQAAHVVFPNLFGIPNVLVPIGPDEDPHLRICRDVAELLGYRKPSVIHSLFLPGIDGSKMSKSKNNAIYLLDSEKETRKKIMNAFSGGQASIEEHRRIGGDPDVDIPFTYLKYFFLPPDEARRIASEYRSGKMLSGEMKTLLYEKLEERMEKFRKAFDRVTYGQIDSVIIKNDETDIVSLCEKYSI
jgi:tryptophanyl-tRNA synthetase